MILLPAVPWTPRTNVSSGMLTTESSSLPCVVKSSPWSADCGGVPDAIVIVPPCLPPELPLALPELVAAELLELDDEPPHAASATAAATPSSTAEISLVYLFTDPPPQRSGFPDPGNLVTNVIRCEPVGLRRAWPNQRTT